MDPPDIQPSVWFPGVVKRQRDPLCHRQGTQADRLSAFLAYLLFAPALAKPRCQLSRLPALASMHRGFCTNSVRPALQGQSRITRKAYGIEMKFWIR
jgi:hypothetical protein